MEFLLGVIKEGGVWSAGFAALLAYWLFVFSGLHEDASRVTRDRWIQRLRYEDWSETYRQRLDAVLDRVDGWLTPEKEDRNLGPWRTAWSYGALNLTLILAVLYPIASLTVQWAWTGAAGEIGGQVVIPAEPELLPRLATILVISSVILFALLGRFADSREKRSLTVFWMGLAISIAISNIIFNSKLEHNFNILVFSCAITYLFTGKSALAMLLLYSVIFIIQIPFYQEGPSMSALTPIILIIIVVIIGFSGIIVQELFGKMHGREGFSLLIYSTYTLIIINIGIKNTPTVPLLPSGESSSSILLLLAILPLLNGLTDFASLGLTRALLRWRAPPKALTSLIDMAGAVATLLLLVCASILFITYVTPKDDVPLIDLARLFDDIEARPENYWWLAFMAFSTLIPTIIHLIAALSSTILLTPMPLRLWIANGLEAGAAGDLERGRNAKLTLALLASFAMWWPSFVILYGGWWVWTADHGLRDWMLNFGRWVAGLPVERAHWMLLGV